MVKSSVLLQTSSSKTRLDAFSKEEDILGILSVFVVDSSRLHLNFVALCLSFVNSR